jgi:hypothetical protein
VLAAFREHLALGPQSQRMQSVQFPIKRLGALPQTWRSELGGEGVSLVRPEQLSAGTTNRLTAEYAKWAGPDT